jgi:hypothetical protein
MPWVDAAGPGDEFVNHRCVTVPVHRTATLFLIGAMFLFLTAITWPAVKR